MEKWGTATVNRLFDGTASDSLGWTAVPVEGKPASESPWVIAARPCADGVNDQAFYYSLPKGEQRTGIYRSGPFAIPEKLSFWCCGHSGFPTVPLNDGNYVRLRDATTHAILAESRPPRDDTAQRFEWDLKEQAGKQGYVELIDGDTANAYAWLAVGRFSLTALNPSDTAKKQQLAAEIVGKLKLTATAAATGHARRRAEHRRRGPRGNRPGAAVVRARAPAPPPWFPLSTSRRFRMTCAWRSATH